LSGYNLKSSDERKCFDEEKMCKDYGKRMMIWAIPFVTGAIIDVFRPGVGCVLAWIGYIVLLIWHITDRLKNEERKYKR
jgi:hypothetical protein